MNNKLRNFKNKEENAKKERLVLKDIIKKHQASIKEEQKKYNKIKKEVQKIIQTCSINFNHKLYYLD